MLVGLQLPAVVDRLAGRSTAELIGYAALDRGRRRRRARSSGSFPLTYRARGCSRAGPRARPCPWQNTVLVAWSGMRGAVSLAAALALPLTTDAGAAFPERDLIIFLTFARHLRDAGGPGADAAAAHQGARPRGGRAGRRKRRRPASGRRGRARAARGARRRGLGPRGHGRAHARRSTASGEPLHAPRFDPDGDGGVEERSQDYQRLRRELLDAERGAVVELATSGAIDDDVMRRVVRDLDLEDARLDV